MSISLLSTAIALRDLNCKSLETADDKSLMQSKIYLAQDIGLSLGVVLFGVFFLYIQVIC